MIEKLNQTFDSIASSKDQQDQTNKINQIIDYLNIKYGDAYDYVDLGLPSGLLWATRNVGANNPWEYGKYFQWGATEGHEGDEAKAHSEWSTCPWGQSTPPLATLDAEHDAATVNMGDDWRMPTKDDFQELCDNTISEWTTMSGINGKKFTSKSNSNNSIFIPAAGRYYTKTLNNAGYNAYVWSSSLYTSKDFAYVLGFNKSNDSPQGSGYRHYGFSVRGVRLPN